MEGKTQSSINVKKKNVLQPRQKIKLNAYKEN